MIPSHDDYCFEYLKKVTLGNLPDTKCFRYKQFIFEKISDSKVTLLFELTLDAGSYEFILMEPRDFSGKLLHASVVEPGNIVFHDNYSTWEADVLP